MTSFIIVELALYDLQAHNPCKLPPVLSVGPVLLFWGFSPKLFAVLASC